MFHSYVAHFFPEARRRWVNIVEDEDDEDGDFGIGKAKQTMNG